MPHRPGRDSANLRSYKTWGAANSEYQLVSNSYEVYRGARLLSKTSVSNEGSSTAPKTSAMHYDANGIMVWVSGENARTLINDLNGRVLIKKQNDVESFSLIANGEMIGSSSKNHETFSAVHQTISSAPAASSGTGVYVVQSDSETLPSVAKALWGDERLWYLIAEANGLTGGEALTVGQPLMVPAKATAIYNGTDTFKSYNASEVIGSTTPELAMPAPSAGKGGCGGLAQLVMIVVAVVATIYTAGAAAGMLGVATGATTTFGAGLAVLTGEVAVGAGMLGAAAIGGAVGSIASQAVGMAIGAQDSFSWKNVALAAIGSGVSAGVMANAGSLGSAFSAAGPGAAAARAALGNVISQGVGNITGLQSGFDWRNVAASAVGAAAGAKTASMLEANGSLVGLFGGNQIANATASGFAAGIGTAVARGGKIEVVRIVTDAFGTALGNSLAPSSVSDGPDSGQLSNARRTASLTDTDFADNEYGRLRARLLEYRPDAQADFATDDELKIFERAITDNGGVLPRSEDFSPFRDISADDLTMQRVVIIGKRLAP